MFNETIINVQDKRYHLIDKVRKSFFQSEEQLKNAMHGIVYLVNPTDEYLYIVEEIPDAVVIEEINNIVEENKETANMDSILSENNETSNMETPIDETTTESIDTATPVDITGSPITEEQNV